MFRAVLCATVVHTHTYEQLLKMSVGLGLGLVSVRLFKFSLAFCAFFGLA